MKATRANFTGRQVEAIGYALDLAHADQEHYINFGDPKVDYAAEWPEVARRKAADFREIGRVGEALGLHGERERWGSLAKQFIKAAPMPRKRKNNPGAGD